MWDRWKRDEIEWKINRRRGTLYQVQLEYVIGLILELHSFPPRIFLFVSVILTNRGAVLDSETPSIRWGIWTNWESLRWWILGQIYMVTVSIRTSRAYCICLNWGWVTHREWKVTLESRSSCPCRSFRCDKLILSLGFVSYLLHVPPCDVLTMSGKVRSRTGGFHRNL